MKRYLGFVFDSYYPAGGWSDIHGQYDTKEEAVREVARTMIESYEYHGQVVDTDPSGVVTCMVLRTDYRDMTPEEIQEYVSSLPPVVSGYLPSYRSRVGTHVESWDVPIDPETLRLRGEDRR